MRNSVVTVSRDITQINKIKKERKKEEKREKIRKEKFKKREKHKMMQRRNIESYSEMGNTHKKRENVIYDLNYANS